ncbi:protein-tyrosine phosphatase-like protein [Mycena olivaceomarginata]|nr:protein-tyrosine phosphatase-like protein [Mycena olivaceomarginata]
MKYPHPLARGGGGTWTPSSRASSTWASDLVAARSTQSLTERRITHVLSVCTDPIPAELPQSGIKHMRIPIEDGVSRSATAVAAYLMWSQRISTTKALDNIRRARHQIWPNPGFQEQLVLFELCQYQPSPTNGIYISWRYKLDRQLKAAGLKR